MLRFDPMRFASRVSTWSENNPSLSGSESYNLGYDGSDQLTTAQLSGTGGILKFYAYGYDGAENRLSSQLNSAITSTTANDLNQLTSGTSGGPLLLSGTLDEPATITIATIGGTNNATVNGLIFSGTATVTTGTNNLVNVVATDASNQAATHQYRITVPAASGTYAYDANGSLTNDGVMTYQWDAANRLSVINETGTTQTLFTYDGLGRRAQIVEMTGSTVTSTKNLIWCGNELCEERNTSDNVTKRYYPQGVQLSGTNYYYTRDHLGSIREVTGSTGILQARYDYDPYGAQTQLSGTLITDIGYAGYYEHQPSGLLLAGAREYRPSLARWISRDPLGERGGINLYGYVYNDPVRLIDPLGLDAWYSSSGGGHASVIVSNPASSTGYSEYSYVPTSGGWNDPGATWNVPGQMNVFPSFPNSSDFDLNTTPQQDSQLINAGNAIQQNPGIYNPLWNNCAHAAGHMLQSAGLLNAVPWIATPNGILDQLSAQINSSGPSLQPSPIGAEYGGYFGP